MTRARKRESRGKVPTMRAAKSGKPFRFKPGPSGRIYDAETAETLASDFNLTVLPRHDGCEAYYILATPRLEMVKAPRIGHDAPPDKPRRARAKLSDKEQARIDAERERKAREARAMRIRMARAGLIGFGD